MATKFPKIEKANFATKNGKFYKRVEGGWRRIEMYVPAVPHTYSSLEDLANSWLDALESGEKTFSRWGVSDSGYTSTTIYPDNYFHDDYVAPKLNIAGK